MEFYGAFNNRMEFYDKSYGILYGKFHTIYFIVYYYLFIILLMLHNILKKYYFKTIV